jgi:hypothetical protein
MKKSKDGNEKTRQSPRNDENKQVEPVSAAIRDYFCTICFEAFRDKGSLDEHMKTHRELEVTTSACRMEAQPAGVF